MIIFLVWRSQIIIGIYMLIGTSLSQRAHNKQRLPSLYMEAQIPQSLRAAQLLAAARI